MPQARQEVGGRRAPDVLVSERDSVLLLDEDPLLDRLVEAGAQVGVERALAAPWQGRRPWRQAVGRQLEGRRGSGQLVQADGPAGKRHETQHAPALRGATGEAGDDQGLERARQ